MSRKVRNIALTVMGLVAMVAAAADAHYIIVSGQLLYHSLDCQSVLQEVLNPNLYPAEGTCSVEGTVVEIECASPNGQIVRGTASHRIVITPVSDPLQDPAEVTKKKAKGKGAGRLTVEVLTDAQAPTLGLTPPADGGVCNNAWTLTRALLRQATLQIDVYVCSINSTDCTPTELVSTAVYSCILPAAYTLDDVPLPSGTTMQCTLESFQHLN